MRSLSRSLPALRTIGADVPPHGPARLRRERSERARLRPGPRRLPSLLPDPPRRPARARQPARGVCERGAASCEPRGGVNRHGPDYGHFVSKDFVSWAAMPVAIWNGLDASAWPPRATPYDNQAHLDGLRRRLRTGRLLTGLHLCEQAIYTGSAAVVEGAGPGGAAAGGRPPPPPRLPHSQLRRVHRRGAGHRPNLSRPLQQGRLARMRDGHSARAGGSGTLPPDGQ